MFDGLHRQNHARKGCTSFAKCISRVWRRICKRRCPMDHPLPFLLWEIRHIGIYDLANVSEFLVSERESVLNHGSISSLSRLRSLIHGSPRSPFLPIRISRTPEIPVSMSYSAQSFPLRENRA